MNNKNNNQPNSPTNDQDVLNTYASTIKPNIDEIIPKNITSQNIDDTKADSLEIKMSEAPKTTNPLDPPFVTQPQPSKKPLDSIPSQSTETTSPEEVKESLKDYNATPIDTPPTPVSLSDNLEFSKSLTEKSSPVIKNKPELIPKPEGKPISESQPEPKIEITPEPEIELNSEPKIEHEMDYEYNHKPVVQTETNPLNQPQEDPEKIKQKIEEVLSYSTASNVTNSQSDKPKSSSLLKILFIASLLLFLIIVGALAYFILNPSSKTNNETKTIPTITPTVSAQTGVVCELNGFIYSQDQSFPSADGCNTCTCVSADNIVCTEKACADVTTKSAVKLTTTPTDTNKAGLNTDSYIGKTPFDPEKVIVGDIVLTNGKVVEKTTNKYGFIKIHLIPVLNGIEVEGSGDYFIFDKNTKVVCEGLPCCDEGSKETAAIWQEEWCTGY